MPQDGVDFETWQKNRFGTKSGEPLEDPEWINYYCGCDLGKRIDFSCLVILQLKTAPNGSNHLDVVHIKRWRLDTSYKSIASKLARIDGMLHGKAAAQGKKCDPVWVVDRGSIGDAVLEMIAETMPNAEVWGGVITGGESKPRFDYGNRVVTSPKRELVSAVTAALSAERLHFPKKYNPEVEALIQEMLDFEVKASQSGHESFNGKTGSHDDQVVALSLATVLSLTLKDRELHMW
jgi:hypothetical protein